MIIVKDPGQIAQFVSVTSQGSEGRVLSAIAKSGAVRKGHFAFHIGHAGTLLLFREIESVDCKYMAYLLVEQVGIDRSSAAPPLKVFAPGTGGAVSLAFPLADILGQERARVVLANICQTEKRPIRGRTYRGATISSGDRVIVVNDVDRTGKSLEGLVGTVRDKGAEVEAVLLFGVCNPDDHAQRMRAMGVQSYYLAKINLSPVDKDQCPDCQRGDRNIQSVSLIL